MVTARTAHELPNYWSRKSEAIRTNSPKLMSPRSTATHKIVVCAVSASSRSVSDVKADIGLRKYIPRNSGPARAWLDSLAEVGLQV